MQKNKQQPRATKGCITSATIMLALGTLIWFAPQLWLQITDLNVIDRQTIILATLILIVNTRRK